MNMGPFCQASNMYVLNSFLKVIKAIIHFLVPWNHAQLAKDHVQYTFFCPPKYFIPSLRLALGVGVYTLVGLLQVVFWGHSQSDLKLSGAHRIPYYWKRHDELWPVITDTKWAASSPKLLWQLLPNPNLPQSLLQ